MNDYAVVYFNFDERVILKCPFWFYDEMHVFDILDRSRKDVCVRLEARDPARPCHHLTVRPSIHL